MKSCQLSAVSFQHKQEGGTGMSLYQVNKLLSALMPEYS